MRLTRRYAVAGLSALPLVGACGAERSRPLFAADTHPAGYPTVEAVRALGSALEARTEGRLRVKLYPGGQLGEEKDTIEITVFGGLDLNRVNLAPLNAVSPETTVPSLPFLFRSIKHMRRAMDAAPGRAILDALAPHGLIGLCFYDSGARSFYNTKRAVRTPDDMKGLKIRVQNSDLFVAMVEAIGADATPMSFGEVYQGLVQGVVDGAENNWPSFESTRHFEVARYYSLSEHVMAPEVLVASRRAWSRLSETDRELLRAAAQDSVAVMRRLWDERDAASRAIVEAAGVEVVEDVDRPAFAAKMEPVWARFLAAPALRRLADDILAIDEAGDA